MFVGEGGVAVEFAGNRFSFSLAKPVILIRFLLVMEAFITDSTSFLSDLLVFE